MARKHNTKHNRSQSKYPQRLKVRGMSSASVRMEDIETLRKRQTRFEITPLIGYDSLGLIKQPAL